MIKKFIEKTACLFAVESEKIVKEVKNDGEVRNN